MPPVRLPNMAQLTLSPPSSASRFHPHLHPRPFSRPRCSSLPSPSVCNLARRRYPAATIAARGRRLPAHVTSAR